MVTNSKELNFYERIDIEEGLYEGWDKRGYPLKIIWEYRVGPKVEISKEVIELDKLRDVILNYAKRYRPKNPFIYSGPEDNMVELFKAIEKHISNT